MLQSFIPKYGLQHASVAQFLQMLLSTPANTSLVESRFTNLEIVASKRRNYLKPKNLETLFLLSVSKVSITSVTSYKTEINYL